MTIIRKQIYNINNECIKASENGDVDRIIEQKNLRNELLREKIDLAKSAIKLEYCDNKNPFVKAVEIYKSDNNHDERIVSNISEAINELEKIDFRDLFDFDFNISEIFSIPIRVNPKIISVAVKDEQQAKKEIEKIEKEYENYIVECKYSYKEGFDLYVCDCKIYKDSSRAYIDIENERYYVYLISTSKRNFYHEYKDEFDKYDLRLNIIDLFEIFMGVGKREAIYELCKIYNIRIEKYEKEIEKLDYNKNVINNKLLESPIFSYIAQHIIVLNEVINVIKDKIINGEEYKDGIAVSTSLSIIAERIGKKKNTISPVINAFVAIGLLEKAKFEERKGIKNKEHTHNDITYYYVPEYNEEVIKSAEKAIEILKNNDTSISKFDYGISVKLFGVEKTLTIFKDSRVVNKILREYSSY